MLASRIGLLWRPSCCQVSLLDQFLQRADAAGQRDERVGALEHQPLALVHVGRDDHSCTRVSAFSRARQKVRNDAGDLPP